MFGGGGVVVKSGGYPHAQVVMQFIVPLLSFREVYALSHTCRTLRYLIDVESTVWLDASRDVIGLEFNDGGSNALAKRVFLTLLSNVCWSCWRHAIPLYAVYDYDGDAHRLCARCIRVSVYTLPRLHASYNRVRRARLLLEALRLYEFADSGTRYFRRVPRTLDDALVDDDDDDDDDRRRRYVTDDIERLYWSPDCQLRPLPRKPYICHGVAPPKRRRRAIVDEVVYVPECLWCSRPLSTHEAIACRLNACDECCRRQYVVRACRVHRALSDAQQRRRRRRRRLAQSST